MKKFILILVSLSCMFLAGGLRAWADYDETLKSVEENIAGFKERKAALVTQQKELVKQFQANPSLDVYRQIEKLRGDMKTIERHIRSCGAALEVAQNAGSFSGILQEMSKDSNLLYAGLNVVSSVAAAGKWIFGVSNEDLYGSSWQEAESYSKNVMAEARAIREESQDILKALDQVNAILQANGSSEEMDALTKTLNQRLGELEKRKELVRKNLKFITVLYKAEKQNLPASVLFHGEFMGRYTEKVLESVDTARLVDVAIDLCMGDLVSPLIKLAKPLIQQELAIYLAEKYGGGSLTPQIVDDLAFSMLFDGAPGFSGVFKSRAAKEAIRGVVIAGVSSDAALELSRSNQMVYTTLRTAINQLPKNVDFAANSQYLQESADKLSKFNQSAVLNKAQSRISSWKSNAFLVKKLWDLFGKDAVKLYLTSDAFKQAVQSANECCEKYRALYRKEQNDHIETEDEFVNSKWFAEKGVASKKAQQAVKLDALQDEKLDAGKKKYEELAALSKEFRSDLNSYIQPSTGAPGDVPWAEVEKNEAAFFDLFDKDAIAFKDIQFVDAYTLETIAAKYMSYHIVNGDWKYTWGPYGPVNEQQMQYIQDFWNKTRDFMSRRAGSIAKAMAKIKRQQEELGNAVKANLGPGVSMVAAIDPGLSQAVASLCDSQDLYKLQVMADISNWLHAQLPPGLPGAIASPALEAQWDAGAMRTKLAELKMLMQTYTLDLERLSAEREKLLQVDWDTINSWQAKVNRDWYAYQYGISLPGYGQTGEYTPIEVYLNPQVDMSYIGGMLLFGYGYASGRGVNWGASETVYDFSIPEDIMKIFKASLFLEQSQRVLELYVLQNRADFERLTQFNPQELANRYNNAVSSHNYALSLAQAVDRQAQTLQQDVRSLNAANGALSLIMDFNDFQFLPWQAARSGNKQLAARLLAKDTDEFALWLAGAKSKYEQARAGAVIPSTDAFDRQVQLYKEACKAYTVAGAGYYEYLGEFLGVEPVAFTQPDLSIYNALIDNLKDNSYGLEVRFKQAFKALEAMTKALQQMQQQDEAWEASVRSAYQGNTEAISTAISFCSAHSDNYNECLVKIKQTRDNFSGFAFPGELDHKLPPRLAGLSSNPQYQDALARLAGIENEIRARQYSVKERKRANRPELQALSLAGRLWEDAPRLMELTSADLKSGRLEISGRALTQGFALTRVEISLDAGGTWQPATGIDPFYYNFAPEPGKRYTISVACTDEEGQRTEWTTLGSAHFIYNALSYAHLSQDLLAALGENYSNKETRSVLKSLSPDLSTATGNYDQIEESLKAEFKACSEISLRFNDLAASSPRSDQLVVNASWRKTGVSAADGSSVSAEGRATLRYSKEGENWKLSSLTGGNFFAALSPGSTGSPAGPGASGSVETGSATLYCQDYANYEGFIFEGGSIVPANGNQDFGIETNLFFLKPGVGILDLGPGSLEGIAEAPEAGYQPHAMAQSGNCYGFKLANGNYAVIEIKNHSVNDDGSAKTSFKYKYQTNGSRKF